MEKITLTVPVFVNGGVTEFAVWQIHLQRQHPDSPAEIRVIFRETNATGFVQNGKSIPCFYSGAEAENLIQLLNTINLSILSLEKRVTRRCQLDGKLGAGTESGIP